MPCGWCDGVLELDHAACSNEMRVLRCVNCGDEELVRGGPDRIRERLESNENSTRLVTDGGVDVRQWVLDEVAERIGPNDPWTGKGVLVNHANKSATVVDGEEVADTVDDLIDEDELVYWHGLVTLQTVDATRDAVQWEVEEREITRSLLVGKLNTARPSSEQATEAVTDGGWETVLINQSSRMRGSGSNRRVFHLPDPDDPEASRCKTTGELVAKDWEAVRSNHTLCKLCDPDEPDHYGGGVGDDLAARLQMADPDDIVTDGGRPRLDDVDDPVAIRARKDLDEFHEIDADGRPICPTYPGVEWTVVERDDVVDDHHRCPTCEVEISGGTGEDLTTALSTVSVDAESDGSEQVADLGRWSS